MEEETTCQIHGQIGGPPCGKPAPHIWGNLRFCCRHFDDLVEAMFEIRDIVREREHQDFLRIYEQRTHKSPTVEGFQCIPGGKKKEPDEK